MSKKRKKKSSKCPEPFNFLIDMAAGITMNAIANKMENKHHYQKRRVPNPYRASSFGFATGKLNKTEDIIKLGGLMGAMGAFEPNESDTTGIGGNLSKSHSYHTENWEYDNIGSFTLTKNNNRYAWRMNCEDGSAYGINPLDYETRESYNEALQKRKEETDHNPSGGSSDIEHQIEPTRTEIPCEQKTMYVYYRVSRLDNGLNDYYRSAGKSYSVGDTVSVLTSDGKTANAVVISVKEYDSSSLPKSLDMTGFIIDESL